MNKLDLRQIGTLFGHDLYVDVSDMPDITEPGELLSSRDKAEVEVTTTLQKAFNPPKDEE